MGFQNILDANGIGLALTGMGIVFFVLILVSLFIASLPKVLPVVSGFLPVVEHHHGAPMPSAAARPAAAQQGTEEVVAAIGFAMHQRGNG